MEKKIAYTQLKLIELSENHALFTQLVIMNSLFFYKAARSYPYTIDISNTNDSSKAIAQSNIFKQKYFKSLKTFECFEKELLNNEEGIFSIQFPGLTLTIIKLIAPEKSFIMVNSLEKFIRRNKFVHDFNSFTRNVLDSLKILLNNDGVWTDQECRAYFKLTGHILSDLIGHPIPQNLAALSQFGRTSDIDGDKSIDLDAVNGKFQLTKTLLTTKE